jgi:hypothetical protein
MGWVAIGWLVGSMTGVSTAWCAGGACPVCGHVSPSMTQLSRGNHGVCGNGALQPLPTPAPSRMTALEGAGPAAGHATRCPEGDVSNTGRYSPYKQCRCAAGVWSTTAVCCCGGLSGCRDKGHVEGFYVAVPLCSPGSLASPRDLLNKWFSQQQHLHMVGSA